MTSAPIASAVVPADWMPWAQMLHIVFHWTAGGNEARADDRKHYHLLVEQVDSTAKLVRGLLQSCLTMPRLSPAIPPTSTIFEML